MRQTFINTLLELAEEDSRILLLTGDLGYNVLEPFIDRYPERFYNVGVAEQNMIGMTTGLAEAGYIPFVYSIATFATLRPYEFIRNGPVLHQLPVRIIGVGGGFEYGHAGVTHHGLEDIGVMRIQPGITVIAPADYEQARTALLSTWNMSGPVYYRLGKDNKTTVPSLNGRFQLGRVQYIHEGDDALILTMGSVASEVAEAVKTLANHNVSCSALVVASLNPAPREDLEGIMARFKLVFTVEAHYVVGGLGSLVSEIVAEHGLHCRVVRCGVKGVTSAISGSQAYMRNEHQLSHAMLTQTVLSERRRSDNG